MKVIIKYEEWFDADALYLVRGWYAMWGGVIYECGGFCQETNKAIENGGVKTDGLYQHLGDYKLVWKGAGFSVNPVKG